MWPLADTTAALTVAGLVQASFGLGLVRRFRARRPADQPARPAVSVLKPLHGAEPMLEDALASLCAQDYGPMQIVFGVQDPRDAAVDVVERLRRRFPAVDIALVVDATPHGRNRKVANLINMFPAAKHDVIVLADSDVHAPPNYVASLVRAVQEPGVGVATVLYAGLPATRSLAGRLGASGITHLFLPGAAIAYAMGRQDCLGATMALRRSTLESVGGLLALADSIADDHVLGVLVRKLGRTVVLADTVPATTVPEVGLRDLFQHELRWARTIASVVPVKFALAAVQYSLFWAALTIPLAGFEEWAVALAVVAWVSRAAIGHGVDRALGLANAGMAGRVPVWLLPLRDMLSVGVTVASYLGREVVWRGQRMTPVRAARASVLMPAPTGAVGAMLVGTER